MIFQEKLIRLRKTNGYTQENLAEKLGVTRQAIARWEAGETTPDMKMLLGICEIFHVSADYMLHDDYESNEDIPVIKEKNEEIKAVNEKRRQMHLFTAIFSAIATLCFIVGAVMSSHPVQLALSCVCILGEAFSLVIHINKYFKE